MVESKRHTKKTKSERLSKALAEKPTALIRELCKKDFHYFFRFFWDELGGGEELVDNWHIRYICDEAEDVVRRVAAGEPKKHDLLFNVCPGSTKTTILLKALPVWCWINWYWMRLITASYSQTLALEAAEVSRDLMWSPKFQTLFPEIKLKQDKQQKSNYKCIKLVDGVSKRNRKKELIGGSRYTTSVGGTVVGFHCHVFLLDDPLNPDDAISPTILKKTNAWVDRILSTRKVDKKTSVYILLMQRLAQDDPTGHILEKEKKNVRHVCLPGTLAGGYKDLVKPKHLVQYYQDGLFDPIRLSQPILDDLLADLGQYGYAGQIGQNPTPPGGGMFKVENLLIMDNMPRAHEIMETVRYWDKAGTQDGGAYTVGVKMAKLDIGKYLIIDVKRGQWGTDVRENHIKQTAIADGGETTVYIEQEPGSGGKESAESTVRNLAGFNIFKDLPRGDKIYRADPFSVQVNYGNVMLLRGDWNKEFKDELEHFPLSKYKDQVDAAAAAFSYITGKKKVRII